MLNFFQIKYLDAKLQPDHPWDSTPLHPSHESSNLPNDTGHPLLTTKLSTSYGADFFPAPAGTVRLRPTSHEWHEEPQPTGKYPPFFGGFVAFDIFNFFQLIGTSDHQKVEILHSG